jgi:hypothetical protein
MCPASTFKYSWVTDRGLVASSGTSSTQRRKSPLPHHRMEASNQLVLRPKVWPLYIEFRSGQLSRPIIPAIYIKSTPWSDNVGVSNREWLFLQRHPAQPAPSQADHHRRPSNMTTVPAVPVSARPLARPHARRAQVPLVTLTLAIAKITSETMTCMRRTRLLFAVIILSIPSMIHSAI